jgi:hypothetical protein
MIGWWTAVLLIFGWQVLVPPRFDFTAYKESIDYEFKDHDWAVEFANLNCSAQWVKVS